MIYEERVIFQGCVWDEIEARNEMRRHSKTWKRCYWRCHHAGSTDGGH